MEKHSGASYDEIAAKYADRQDKKPWNLYFERPGILRSLPDVADKDVLDAGCGPGFYSQKMLELGARVTSFDLNPVFVQRTLERTGERARVLQADLAEPLDFLKDASFDLVVCILVLHYLRDWEPALLEFKRILRPDGLIFFSTHHPFTDLQLSTSADYFATELLEDEWDIGKVSFYRRPLSKISRDLYHAGFLIEELLEPQPIKPPDTVTFEAYEKAMKTPMRLLIRARKCV
ncbi:MAG: class I SAM-dependent methyltransferase [Trueperaceae bacterium]|nr:class I SAM-dependent methyltransferase [Trueperaceae bacterium]